MASLTGVEESGRKGYKTFPREIWEMICGFVLGGGIYNVIEGDSRNDMADHMRSPAPWEILLFPVSGEAEQNLAWALCGLPGLMLTNKQHWENGKRQFFGLNRFEFINFEDGRQPLPEDMYRHCQYVGTDTLCQSIASQPYYFRRLTKFARLKDVYFDIGYDGLHRCITQELWSPSGDLADCIMSLNTNRFPSLPQSVTHIHLCWGLIFIDGHPHQLPTLPKHRGKFWVDHAYELRRIHRIKEFSGTIEELHNEFRRAIEPPLRKRLMYHLESAKNLQNLINYKDFFFSETSKSDGDALLSGAR